MSKLVTFYNRLPTNPFLKLLFDFASVLASVRQKLKALVSLRDLVSSIQKSDFSIILF